MSETIDLRILALVKEKLSVLYLDYDLFMDDDIVGVSSSGLISSYTAHPSGRTNKTSDMTAVKALRRASLDKGKVDTIAWLECVYEVYMRGTEPYLSACKSMRDRLRFATVSFVLYYKVLKGYSFDKICEIEMPHRGKISRTLLYKYWTEAAKDVAVLAIERGLVAKNKKRETED